MLVFPTEEVRRNKYCLPTNVLSLSPLPVKGGCDPFSLYCA